MIHVGIKRIKITVFYVAALALIIGGGFSVYAELYRQAYVVETVHVFPSTVTATGFENIETITFQNLDEFALLQDFNAINSATLNRNFSFANQIEVEDTVAEQDVSTETEIVSVDDQPASPAETAATTTTDSAATSTTPDAEGPQTDSVASSTEPGSEVVSEPELEVAESEQVVPETEAQSFDAVETSPHEAEELGPEVTADEADATVSTTTVLRSVDRLFALTIDTLTETFSSTSATTSPVADEVTEVLQELVVEESLQLATSTPKDELVFGFATTSQTADSPTVVGTTSSSTAETESGETATTTNPLFESDEVGTTTVSVTGSSTDLTQTNTSVATSSPDRSCEPNCDGYVLSLQGFAFPLDEGVSLSGAQLRMSFAATHKATRKQVPSLVMNYSLDAGETWSTGGAVVIDDEESNSINGGYYLFALPAITDQSLLQDLHVELRYDDDSALVEELYIESAWLELFTLRPPTEPVETDFAELLADDGYVDSKLSGDTLELPSGEELLFSFTDNNDGETLIIKSDQKTYDGLSEVSTHFSVTNTSDQSDEFSIQTYFPREVGEVTGLSVFNLNQPRVAVVPEYRPYVYHCATGWESGVPASQMTLSEVSIANVASSSEAATSSVPELVELADESATSFSTTTVLTDESDLTEYHCAASEVVRSCDVIEGESTACVVQEKVQDHEVTRYAPGWDPVFVTEGELEEGGVLSRVSSFFGFGPDRKEVPVEFVPETYTDNTFTIAPGETRYFKLDISFPPFSSGEYWIEAIGDREYGLLDPFWSSQWQYRVPITIDNVAGATTLTEHQVFLELDSSLTDFWTNVQPDGGDIRFVQETVVGNEEDWYGTGWERRTPITIQATEVIENLTDFPVYVDLSDLGSGFFSSVQSDGDDIRITESDGLTEVPYELVAIDTGAETGELHFLAGSVSSSTDTTFYVYHDNPNVNGYSATDPFGAEAVWGSEFIAVYHLEEAAAGRGSAGLYQDSTSNDYDGDDELNSTGKTGLLGQGQEIDSQGDPSEYLLLPSDVVNGENQLTFSYWFNSSETNNQALINGGANNDYLIFMQSGGTAMNLFPGSTVTVDDVSIAPSWRHVMVSRDATNNEWRIFIDGVEDNNSPSASTMSVLSIPADCLVVGLEQDTSCLNSTDLNQHTNGFIDEMRFQNVVPTAGEINAQFRNQSAPNTFYTVGSEDTLTITTFNELDHWVQHFSTTTDEADIWVQVDTIAGGASTTIYLYYGSTGATSASDEFAPFTYSSLQDLYYVVHDDTTQNITVFSLIDNNQVQVDGGTVIDLNKGESTSITSYTSDSVIRTLGPITSRQVDNEGEPVVPIAFATTTHVIPSQRNTEEFHIYSPHGSTSVQIFDQTTQEVNTSIATGTVSLITNDISAGSAGIVESSLPVLVYAEGGNNDSIVSYPPSVRDLYGFHSQDWFVSTAETSVDYDVYCSGGASSIGDTVTRGVEGGDGGSGNPCTTGADAGGDAVRITNQTGYLSAIQQADSDGGESTTFLPELEFGTEYYIPVNVDYVAAVCSPRFGTSTLEIYNSGGTTLTESATCIPGVDTPGTVRFTRGSSGDDQQYNTGTRIVSTNNVPFYVIYDHTTDDDETNTWSAVQARKYDEVAPGDRSVSYGAQEVNIDAEYTQSSFGWYENADVLTPTTTWSLGDDGDTTEGVAITGQGAVNAGDVLRLRMNLSAAVATGSASSSAFTLQYAVAEACSTAAPWYDVGKVGSTTAAFSGYNNSSIDDGVPVSTLVLASSTVSGTYEESNFSAGIQTPIGPGEFAEFDWVITNSNAVVNTTYCFRMIRASGNELTAYSVYPQLLTSGPPEVATLLERFDNEHATSTSPTLEFVASDLSGDDLQYQIQIDDDVSFVSTAVDYSSDGTPDFLQFENVAVPADKAPFTSGQIVRFTTPITLTGSTTYWWRVRSIDPNGSNTFSDWSTPASFTINESLSVSEWFQTTDEQFETNSLSSATTSDTGSVEPDLGGSSLLGEYGSLEIPIDPTGTTTVNLNNTYTDPVVVVSLRYARSVANGDQPYARVFNKTGTSFDVLASTFDFTSAGSTTLDYVVMEAGEALIDDGGSGLRVFATSTSVGAIEGSTIANDPTGAVDITFPTTFSAPPVVLAAITTNNDPNFLVPTVYDGTNIDNPPTASQVSLYLNDSLASDGHGSAENMDIIAIDPGAGTNDSVAFAAQVTDTDVTHVPVAEPFANTYSSAPGVILTQQRTMFGGQGGYAMIDTDTPATATEVTVAFEEGGTSGNRDHTTESLALLSFESSGGDIIRSGNAQVVSTPIDFDDADVGNAWGEVSFTDIGDITYRVEYQVGSGFVEVPDIDLPGNSTGFTSGPINILDLDTDTYNVLRLVADLSGASPELLDWTVTWGQRVNIPSLGDPYDNQKVATTTPTFDFTTTDPQGDALTYEISWSTDNTFTTGSTTYRSDTSVDFNGSSPYASGDTVTFTIAPGDALSDGTTYWWRVRAIDLAGGNSFSPWSEPDSFTVDSSVVVSTWFQTTEEQFLEGELDGVTASTSDSIEISTDVGEYGTTSVSGNSWQTINTQLTYNNMVVVASPRYNYPGNEDAYTAQVRNKTNNSFEIRVNNYAQSIPAATQVDYVVMEAGDWEIVDGTGGIRFIAGTAPSVSNVEGSVPGYTGGTLIDFAPNFTAPPAVLATIASDNGSKWVGTVVDDASAAAEVAADEMYLALGIGRDSDTVRTAEDIDYIAIETGTGTNNSVLFDVLNSPDVVTADQTSVSFNQTFSTAPGVIVVHNNANDGSDGAFALVDLDIAVTSSAVGLATGEVQPASYAHANEIVSLLAFESGSGTIRRESTVSGGLTGTIASEPVLFTDGAGPKFSQALFSTTSPGLSSTSVQVQYEVSDGVWALIPDSQIPGNSTGSTVSPIDLTNVDVSTFQTIRLLATLQCDTTNCPTLDDWTVEWSEGVPISGTIAAYDRTTPVTSGTVRVAVNALAGNTGTINGDGTWSISNVTAFDGDVVTVWVDGATTSANRAVSVFVYDGIGDMINIELYEQHLTLSADENGTTTNALLGVYDNSVSGDADIFFDVDAANDLRVCATTGCSEANLYIGPGDIYVPDTANSGNVTVHDFVNDGTFELDGNTMRVSGSWDNNASTDLQNSTVIFTATSTAEVVDDSAGTLSFENLTFGETFGVATWKTNNPLDLSGDLVVAHGTFDRASSSITVAGDVTTETNGIWSGVASTTFDGTGSAFWTDNTSDLQDIGYVVVDGLPKTLFVSSDVAATTITIGSDDTLNAGGANTIELTGDFTNSGTFVSQTSTVVLQGTSSAIFMTLGGSELYNLTASTSVGTVSFVDSTVTVLGDITIATGTLNLAADTTIVDGSFTNTGGFFTHNNATVRFTSAGSETIQLLGTDFLNHFYNVTFTGSGDWVYLDANATTSNTHTITNGTVTLPSGQLTVSRDFLTSGGGAFTANGGELVLLIDDNDVVTTNGSSLHDVTIRNGVAAMSGWYNDSWLYRVPVTVRASAIDDDLSTFPVYVDLADLPSSVFTNLTASGGDIRVTESDGTTEVPREVVAVDTVGETGELHFRATSVSSTTDTVFYIYYGNATATDYAATDPNGAEAVWNNNFVLVEHLNDLTTSTVLNSADGTLNGTKTAANTPIESATGQIYEAQEFDGSDISIAHGDVASGASSYSFSGWFNTDDLLGSGDTATFGYTVFAISPSAPYQWLTVGGTGFTDELRICAYESTATVCTGTSGASLTTDQWYYVALNAVDGGLTTVRINDTEVLSYTNDGDSTVGNNFTIGDLRPGRDIDFDGELDEFRFATAVRSTAWHDATYRNQATTTDFYTVGSPQQDSVRTFADTSAAIDGDLVIQTGTAVFPVGTLRIGGSLDNDSEFDANGGTVTFNSSTSAETIEAGVSPFYNLVFDSVGGDWLVLQSATATNDILLANGDNLAFDLDVVLESQGTFTNEMNNADTSWAGATLRLSSGNDMTLNTKSHGGDTYNTIVTTGDTVARMWNSTASTYDTQDTSAIYSQDHDGIDGDLYIYGDYTRESGTEYWSYATDFDGADLVASSSERQANVRVAAGASVTASSSTLEIQGSPTASTTVNAQTGSYSLLARAATVDAQYFTMTGTDASGFQLLSSSTVTSLDTAEFTIPAASAAITVDASTVDTNPTAQFFNTNFVSGGGSINVSVSGAAPSSFWWFRDGAGDRYGEAFDNNDADPGQIQWDDSNYQITVSGTVFSDNGASTSSAPTCNGSDPNVRIVVDGGAYTDTTSCNGLTGFYEFTNVSYGGDAAIVVYLDTGGAQQGTVVTRTPTGDITDMDIYAEQVIVRHEDTATLSIADMALYDNDDDPDIRFTAATTSVPDELTVLSGSGLYVWDTKEFVPNGTVDLQGAGATSADGSLTIGPGAVFTSTSTDALTIGGSFFVDTAGTFAGASSTVTFTATNTGPYIGAAASSTVTFYDVVFDGVGGSWAIQTPTVVTTDVVVTNGTVTGVSDLTVEQGTLTGAGIVDMTGGTVTLEQGGVLGGANEWTFNNLVLGDGLSSNITTRPYAATTTIRDTLTIASAHFLNAFSSTWDLSGSGTVFETFGSFIQGTSTVRYSGATPNVLRTAYNNLVIDTDSGSVVATAPSTGLQVLGDLTVGVLNTATLDLNTNDPLVAIDGDLYIGPVGTIAASDSNTLNVFGSWDNDGVFTANGGLVEFSLAAGSATIAAGTSAFADMTISGGADYTITESATTTGAMQIAAGGFTLQPGLTLAVGGTFTNDMDDLDTTWLGTTLRLFGGQTYTVNDKSTGDTYSTLDVSGGTQPRFWNSVATTSTMTEAGSSVYSMDHADVAGDLYIFGDLVSASFDDYWSYGEDFDGTTLGVPRAANVQIEDGGTVTYTGGTLTVVGTSSASTTVAAMGTGPYDLVIGGSTTVTMNYYQVREIDSAGLTFTGAPSVTDLSYGDFEPATGGASGMTVGGTVINTNQALNFTDNRFATTSAIGATNVTATGTSISSWRFVNVIGNLDSEQFDVDPGGDPGYLVWQDSASVIDISGTVYQSDRSSVSSVCGGGDDNIRLSIGGLTFASTSCDGSGDFTFTGVNFGPTDTLTVYIDGEAETAATVTRDPISFINNFDLYENHVIVRHESATPLSIAAMAVYDSSDDGDIPFTAVTGPDTLTLDTDFALVIWDDKTFAPGGDVTIPGAGAGASHDGQLELFSGSVWDAASGETHSIGGSLTTGALATFDADLSTTTFTSVSAGRTINTNDAGFNNVEFTGSGAWSITDAVGDINGDMRISAGTVTLPAATTTITGSLFTTGGTFVASGGSLVFDATAAGNTVTFGGSEPHTVRFAGPGSWIIGDTHATTTDSFTVASGTVTLPSGVLTVADDFVVEDTVTHSAGTVRVTGTGGGNLVTLSGNDLFSLTIDAGVGDYTLTDASAAFTGSLTLVTGEFSVGTGTVSISDSFDVSGGVFNNGTGTLLFNSTDAGEFIDPGDNDLYNLVISGTGGWNLTGSATTTNNFSLLNAGTFTVTPGSRVYVGNVFANDVGGAATTWTNTTLVLDGANEYEINDKSVSAEAYQTLVIGENSDISSWNSSAVTATVASSSSWYSQNHAGVSGDLYIYGDYHIATTTEYWSAATDFDGSPISTRSVQVRVADTGAVTLSGGALEIIGTAAASTSISNQGSGSFDWSISAGTLGAEHYSVTDLTAAGLQLSGTPTITSLDNGYFTQSENNQDMITLASTTLNANASLLITSTGFANGSFTGGRNVSLDATTTNSWTFTGALGNLWGESFDVDGVDNCSSIRWDDSDCLLSEQTDYRWRLDDGGEGAPSGTWFDTDWSTRQRIRVLNTDAQAYATTAVKFTVPYDAAMQADFDDIRVTAADGITLVNHWTERVWNPGSGLQADIWLQASALATSSVTEFYLYFGNVSAVSTSDGAAVFDMLEDFEPTLLTSYDGDTGLFNIGSSFAYGGSLGLDASGNESSRTTDGIARYDRTVSQGQRIRYLQYIDPVGGSLDDVCTLFGVQGAVTGDIADHENYAICVRNSNAGDETIYIARDVNDIAFSGTVLSTETVAMATGWYEFIVDWGTDDVIDLTVNTETGTFVASSTATDSSYTTGDIGFTFWFQNGGWDSYLAYDAPETTPTVYLGANQVDGGATWAGAQNTPTGGFLINETARLRIALENTGLDITNQNFQLEYAPKLTAPTCEAVSPASFIEVPPVASCGVGEVCMSTSSNITNGAATTDHLVTDAGQFVAGEIVTDPSNETASFDLNQDRYTELEYAIALTSSVANDAYCFRVTNDGSALDSYATLPELTLAFDPVLDPISLNDGLDITLTGGATTTVIASTTVTDLNGVSDLAAATTTFYKTSATAACTADDNNCYIATSTCAYSNCTATSCTLQCTADFAYHTDPTDLDGAEEWFAFVEVSDVAGAVDFATSPAVELLTLRAMDVQNDIAYGVVDVTENTGTFNPTTLLLNIGNEPIDIQISGTDMTDNIASIIPAGEQLYATSTFDYDACVGCNPLSVTPVSLEVDLAKPTSTTPGVSDTIYWGIEVPFGTASNPHSGTNFFTAVAD